MSLAGEPAWRAELIVSHPHVKSLMASLVGEEDVEMILNSDGLKISLSESSARNLRAFWNTRLRSLQVASGILDTIEYDE